MPVLDPRELAEWYALTEELPAKIKREKELRQRIFGVAFANPTLGTNRLPLGHGKDLKAVHKMTLGVDRQALAAADTTTIPSELFHSVVKFSPGVSEGGWNAATDSQKALFSAFVTVRPALPAMEIVNVKTRG